jgi:hypothetical protein
MISAEFQLESEVTAIQRAWGITPKQLTDFKIAIRTGIKRRIPDHMWWLKEEAEQDAWLSLFERQSFNGRDANVFGQTAGRRQVRAVGGEIPISQIEALRPNGLDSDPLMPWDYAPVQRFAGFDEQVYQLIDDSQENIRCEIIRQFQTERPEDYKFLLAYILSKRKLRHTAQERRRARSIISRLRRLEATELFPERASA